MGQNIRFVGRSVEDDRVLLAAPSERTFERVGSGEPPTRDVRTLLTDAFLNGSAFTLQCCIYRYVGLPNNSFAGIISAAQGWWGRALQLRRRTRRCLQGALISYNIATKCILSDTTPLNVNRRTVAGSLPEGPASTVGY